MQDLDGHCGRSFAKYAEQVVDSSGPLILDPTVHNQVSRFALKVGFQGILSLYI
jgi:hypothetical protein